jgi:hypothetical protein
MGRQKKNPTPTAPKATRVRRSYVTVEWVASTTPEGAESRVKKHIAHHNDESEAFVTDDAARAWLAGKRSEGRRVRGSITSEMALAKLNRLAVEIEALGGRVWDGGCINELSDFRTALSALCSLRDDVGRKVPT